MPNSPERIAALNKLASTIGAEGALLSELITSVDDLIAGMEYDRDHRERSDFFRAMFAGAGMVVSLVLLVGLGLALWQGFAASHERTHLLRQQNQIARVANEVHSAVTPGQPLYEQAQREQEAVIDRLVNEDECRVRNAMSGGPDVPPGQGCLSLHPESQHTGRTP